MPIKSVLALPDIHAPLHDVRSLAAVEGFMRSFKPNIVVYPGDQLEMDPLSHWLRNKRRALEGQRLDKDYELFNRILDRHQAILPRSTFVFIHGNHEDWVQQYIDLHPEVEGLLEVSKGLRLVERGFRVIPFGGIFTLGKLHYMHGVYTDEHHAKTTALAFRCNIRYGHTHDIQSHTITSPMNISDRVSAGSIGCLCNTNPHYMRNKPNRWQHGFNFAYLWRDGRFTDYTVQVIGGKFVWNGKEYRG